MVSFAPEFVNRMRRKLEFYQEADAKGLKGELSVEVVKHDNLLSEAFTPGGDIAWFSDEPRRAGGLGKGVSPLAYFISSLGLCQFVHYAEHASTSNIPLDTLRMRIRAVYSMAHPRSFEEIDYEVYIESKAERGAIEWLAKRAADDCYVTNTLKRACKVKGRVFLNGMPITEL